MHRVTYKTTLDTTKIPHKCPTDTLESKILLFFTLRLAISWIYMQFSFSHSPQGYISFFLKFCVDRAQNDLKMTLNATRSKVPHICCTMSSPISVRLTLRSLVFQIIEFEISVFPIWYKGEFEIFRKKKTKTPISKNPKYSFMRTFDKKNFD